MATQLADGLWRIACRGVNVYLWEGDELVLVDAGTPIDAGRIRAGLAAVGHAVADVERVVVTHFDLDHVGALWRLDDELTAPVYLGEPDRSYLTREASPDWSPAGAFRRVLRPFSRPPALDVRPVADGEALAGLTAYHTPGHTPGHTVYANDEVAFLGDLVFGDGETYRTPPGFINFDSRQVAASIRELAAEELGFESGCQGHGDPLPTGGGEALSALAGSL
jgi:glyoxylase-like metal-dependent hydrolase (beta-lactamase superfamily II)